MTVKAAIPTNKAVTRLMCASLVPSLCYHITDYVMAKEMLHSRARFRSEIDLIGASQMRRFAPKRTHAPQYGTPVTTTPQQACDRTEDAILKSPVHGTD